MQVLIERIKSNDRKAQETLYHKYADRFFYFCFRYTNNSSDAAEVLNNGFFKIFSNIHSFSFINNLAFEGWMYRILVNEALMFLRQSQNHLLNTEIDNTIQNSTSYTDHYLSDEDCLKLLQMLPVGYRTVFNLYAIEGYSHKEIGEMLDITESTSRSQLSRARELLKSLIIKEL
jgi:RNA polymerase sigma-70 factor (ECF subfamily)